MNTAEYLSDILLGQDSKMISDFIFVVLPVLSITILMFSLRSIFEDSLKSDLKNN